MLPYNNGRSIVVLGNTYSLRDSLTALGGAYKTRLNIGGAIVKGWELPSEQRASVEQLISAGAIQQQPAGAAAPSSGGKRNVPSLTDGPGGRLLIGGNTYRLKGSWITLGGYWVKKDGVWSLPASARSEVERLLAAPSAVAAAAAAAPAARRRGGWHDEGDFDYVAEMQDLIGEHDLY